MSLHRLLAIAGLISGLAAGCGPTGGGTGGSSLAANGASALSVCSSAFASTLSCAGTSLAPATPQQLDGTVAVYFVGESVRGPFVLTFEDNQVELQSRCQATRFEGEWGAQPGTDARFFGEWTAPERGAAAPATMRVVAVAGAPPAVQVSVQASDGSVLLGPLQLQRTEGRPTAAPSCP
ncbi:hypothetical protein [Pseudorhodoferax sp.]|uniref:hypothetical protein n=1 Tax=Pseudorhodoferax sp. TaxID=1993553 RepID=UPI002DD6752F|nr:hypothetical protein [Pseudorhodoferax sp.]